MLFNVNKKGGIKVKLISTDGKFDCNCELLKHLKEKEIFTGKANEIYVSSFENAVFVGLGETKDFNLNLAREIFFSLSKELSNQKIKEIELEIPKFEGICNKKLANAIAEGMLQATYEFDKFLSDKKEKIEITVNYNPLIDEAKFSKVEEGIKEAQALINSIFLTRELVNLPSNYIYPETLAKRAKEILEPVGVKVSVYDKAQIKEMGLEAFYSVGKGSDNEPRLIVMEYLKDENSNEKIAFVGKGITYDSGGYSIKPSNGMKDMFCDMAGGATVIGALHTIATQGIKANIVGVIAACENAVSGRSYKPGDIIGSLSGKSIEVENTDAEGRLTLADAVYYASSELKATKIIDLATLTGACLVALGEVYTGALTNNQELLDEILSASKEAGEKIWQLPNDPQFAKMNKSKVADIKNLGGSFAGTITAGQFIGEFVNNLPWVHLDIAGTAFLSSPYSYLPFGATGIHVKTLYNLVKKTNTCKIK